MFASSIVETPLSCYVDAMDDVRDFLERRLKEARKELAPAESEAAELRAKIDASETRVAQIKRTIKDIERALNALGRKERLTTTLTIKEAILKILADAPNGLASAELVRELNVRFFEGELARASMSPQITRLVRAHKIKQRGEKYFLA